MDEKLLLEAIRNIVREEVKAETEPLRDDIKSLKVDMAHHNHHVEPLLEVIKEGIDGLQDRNKQIDRLEIKVNNYGDRIFALEQIAKAN